jgi:hypothetical protein
MNKPYYELNPETKNIVLELIQKCKVLKLGNINFQYFFSSKTPYEVFFYVSEYNTYWELIVKQEPIYKAEETDVYKIVDGVINYDYSEKD